MTQITINVEDKSLVTPLKKVLNAINGVTVVTPEKKRNKVASPKSEK